MSLNDQLSTDTTGKVFYEVRKRDLAALDNVVKALAGLYAYLHDPPVGGRLLSDSEARDITRAAEVILACVAQASKHAGW